MFIISILIATWHKQKGWCLLILQMAHGVVSGGHGWDPGL